MRNQRPPDFGRKDGKLEYDMQGKPRLPAQMRTGYDSGGYTSGPDLSGVGGRAPIGTLLYDSGQQWGTPRTTVRKMGLSQAEQVEDLLGAMQKSGYGPPGRDGGFDADYYLKNNPEVAAAVGPGGAFQGYDPYIHYNLYGRSEGRLGSAPRPDPAAAAQASFSSLTPVGGGGNNFNASADLASQQATGAATLAQMRGGAAPGALTAPAAAPNRMASFTPSATGNAPPAGGQQSFTPSATGNAAPPVPMAGGGEVENQRNPMDPISDDVRRARGENSVSYGFERIPKAPTALELKQDDLMRFPLERNLPETYNDPLTNEAIRANKREKRSGYARGGQVNDPRFEEKLKNRGPGIQYIGDSLDQRVTPYAHAHDYALAGDYAGGGPVEEMMPRQPVSPQSMIPPAGSGPALNRFGMNRGRTQMKRGYAEGGEVDDNQTASKAEDTYVTGDQLAKQVEERFSQALETDDKYRRGYDDGGDVATGGTDPEEIRRLQEEAERQRMAEEAAAAEREAAARQPAPEQPAPAARSLADEAGLQDVGPATPSDGVPSPAQPAAVADAQAQAEQQTNDWLAKVIDYSHSKVDPSEYGPPRARTGYNPDQDRGDTVSDTGATDTGGADVPPTEGPELPPAPAAAPATPARPAGAGPATPPEQGATVSPTAGWGELIGAGLKKAGQAIAYPFVQGAEPRSVSRFSPTMTIAEMLNGKDANYTVEQLQQLQEQDPRGDHNATFQRLADQFEQKRDLDGAHKLSQSMRNPYAGMIATAQAANAAQNPEATARLLDRAHNFLTNKTLMKTVPTESGFDITLTSEVDGTSQQRSLTKNQMTEFLNSNGVQYDAMAKNSTLKHLDIATGRRGQLDIDIGKLPVSDETSGYTPQEPPMTQGAPRTSDFTTVPPPAAGGAAAPAPAAAAAATVDAEKLARATAHIPREGTPATGDEIETAKYMLGRGRAYPPTMEQIQDAVEQTRTSMRTAIEDRLRPRTPAPPAPAPGPNTGYNRASDIGAGDIGGKPRHPAWEGLPVAGQWEQGKGYQAPSWPNISRGEEEMGRPFARGPGGSTLPQNVTPRGVGPYIPAGGDQGALRIPPNGQAPAGWRTFPAEDAHEGSGRIALPPGAAPATKDITMYNGAGQPVPMRVPDFWDPNKIKYSQEGRSSGEAVFPNPPGTKFNQQGDAVRPISSYASTLATPAPGRGPGAPAPIARGGSDFTGPQPWQPTYGPGTAGVPPPAGDTSPDAVAARRNPATSQAGNRAKEAMALDALASKETNAETAAAGRVGAADVTGQYRTAATGMQQAGAMDRAQFNAGARATAASEKFDHEMKKLETREGGLNDRAAMRDATNRYKIETISSDKGREIAARALNARQQQDLSTYRTKIAQGAQHTPEEQAAYDTFRAEVARNGYRVPPPDDQAPAPAPAQAAPAAQAPAPGRGRLTVPVRGGANAGAAASQTAQSMAGGQATAASAGAVDPRAIEYLRANPATRAQFDARYGSGLADSILGGR